MESRRNEEGFYQTDYFLFVDGIGSVYVLGEEPGDNRFHRLEEPEKVQLWQCPPALRKYFRVDFMHEVLGQMVEHEANWSWSTAIRAVLLPAEVPVDAEEASTLNKIMNGWKAEPICTSVVIVFWQRYLCKMAEESNATAHPNGLKVNPLEWIVNWMPLQGDRALPGEMLRALRQHGWVLISHLDGRGGAVVSL
jgi:hypothetical protein